MNMYAEFVPSLKTRNLVIINIIVAVISLLIIYYFDTPIELIGATGIAWVSLSCIETIRKLRKLKKVRKQTLAYEEGHHSFSQG